MAKSVDPVLITGCSTGIGRATAIRLASSGHLVYATARRIETLDAPANAGCRVLSLDVTDEDSMAHAVSRVVNEHGAIGTLVNNAGYGLFGPVEEAAMGEIRRQFDTNLFGLIRMIQLVLPSMRRQGRGTIVNLSSMGGRTVVPGGAFYHASKFAL